MIRLRWISIIAVILLFSHLSVMAGDSGHEKDFSKLFKVDWESVNYNKSVSRNNPAVSSSQQNPGSSKKLSLMCKIKLSDPNLILGVSRQGEITQLTDNGSVNLSK